MGGLDYCAETGQQIKRMLCGRCASCRIWVATRLTNEELAEEVARRVAESGVEAMEAVAPDLLHGEAKAGFRRMPRLPGSPPTARCLGCERLFSARGIVRHVRGCQGKRRRVEAAKPKKRKGPSPNLLPSELGDGLPEAKPRPKAEDEEFAEPDGEPQPLPEPGPAPVKRNSLRDALARFDRTREP